MQKILFLIIFIFFLMITGAIFFPAPFPVPASWTPDPAPELLGLYAKNKKLLSSELLGTGEIYGPEDVAVDEAGIVYGGTQDGKIIRIPRTTVIRVCNVLPIVSTIQSHMMNKIEIIVLYMVNGMTFGS